MPKAGAALPATGAQSGLPLPRFVSLKSDKVHVRQGPGLDHRLLWTFQRAGLPVEVIQEFEGWRQVRDADGGTGWVLQSLLSGRRTGLVLPWELKADPGKPPQVPVRTSARADADAAVIVEAGVIANILGCDGNWCRIAVGDVKGHIEQKKLWGVYEGERMR